MKPLCIARGRGASFALILKTQGQDLRATKQIKKIMANVNRVILLGNITREIEVSYTTKGTAVADLGLAVNRVRTAENGEKIEETTFVDITLWGKTAEIAGQYLSKGSQVYIEGRLHLNQWEDKETGKKRSKLKVVGENLQFIGRGDKKPKDPPRGEAYEMAAKAHKSANSSEDNQNYNPF